MPFPFVHSSKGAWTNSWVKHDLTGLNLPVVAWVSLVPRPLQTTERHLKTQKQHQHQETLFCCQLYNVLYSLLLIKVCPYNLVFLLRTKGSCSFFVCRGWWFGLRPSSRALTWRASTFKRKRIFNKFEKQRHIISTPAIIIFFRIKSLKTYLSYDLALHPRKRRDFKVV